MELETFLQKKELQADYYDWICTSNYKLPDLGEDMPQISHIVEKTLSIEHYLLYKTLLDEFHIWRHRKNDTDSTRNYKGY